MTILNACTDMTTPSSSSAPSVGTGVLDVVAFRALAVPVPTQLDDPPTLRIRHPGYPDSNNVLLTLLANDSAGNVRGIQRGIVHTACAVFANNRFDGRLSQSLSPVPDFDAPAPDSGERLPADKDYFFHVPPCESDEHLPWPVVPNFRQWLFPHQGVPRPWHESHIAKLAHPLVPVKARDGTCRLTAYSEVLEVAHIIPASESEWFASNNMDQYAPGSRQRGADAIRAEANLVTLREDILTLWDGMNFSVVPKRTAAADGDDWAWTAHVYTMSPELRQLYHNHQLQPLFGVKQEYLFARFAWDIFPHVQGFLQREVSRWLVAKNVVHEYTPSECKTFTSSSPKKRSRSRNDDNQDACSLDSGTADSDEKDEPGNDALGDEVEEEICLRRRRQVNGRWERARERDDDPHGFKRRREVSEDLDDTECERGRKPRLSP
ncbi:hypothetical protein B0A55_05975 [Friedmanniomyces simplex]|uniref:HNH nuclease domain-containing protein n=1 Tax=Friedmanniomyces simplex TaxID=329884 RepID=A0A4U0X7W3_9PEZI|nr:hypothetical protein B0A55_05975 [Friedmanniomyces simplex]